MHLYIVGIGGTFMGGLAMLASEQGHRVMGYDRQLYPPMSDLLAAQGITADVHFTPEHWSSKPDLFIIGNVCKRGDPVVEWILNEDLPYISGPQWLAENILHDRRVIAVSGTHGKTTTASMLAWLLESLPQPPGFLIAGSPCNFSVSARLGESPWFVVEADEYDSAFFDKRSKFLHYRPEILLINNLEFDHADIFENLAQIEQQFAYLLRTVKGDGCVVWDGRCASTQRVVAQGCWSRQEVVHLPESDWHIKSKDAAGQHFQLVHAGESSERVAWSLMGQHNLNNALMASVAAHEAGVSLTAIGKALASFRGVKRRLEYLGVFSDVTLYDDFAHHPTAIASTLSGLRALVGNASVKVVFQFASNTMCRGIHNAVLAAAFAQAQHVYCLLPEVTWDFQAWLAETQAHSEEVVWSVHDDWPSLSAALVSEAEPGDHVVLMTNRDSAVIADLIMHAL